MGSLAASLLLHRIAKNPSPGHYRYSAANGAGRDHPDQLKDGGQRAGIMDGYRGNPRDQSADAEGFYIATAVDRSHHKRRRQEKKQATGTEHDKRESQRRTRRVALIEEQAPADDGECAECVEENWLRRQRPSQGAPVPPEPLRERARASMSLSPIGGEGRSSS